MKLQSKGLSVFSVLTLLVAFCAGVPACMAENGQPTEADVTRAVAGLLQGSQFLQLPLDDSLSSQCLDRYLDTLDGAHLLFFQSDLDEFASLRPGLAAKILVEGETRPAHLIYTRYLKRLAQQADYTAQLLRDEKFDFTGHDSWRVDRHAASPPRDLAAAQDLWRQEVREDYLLEKLAGTPIVNIAPALAQRYGGRLQTMGRLNPAEVLGIYLDALAHAYDPHSDYFGHPEREELRIEMNLSLFGIGGTLQAKGGYCIIRDLIPGGPAASSGLLKPGDRIVAVAQDKSEPVDIKDMPPSQVVELIRGPKGSTVRVTIIPAGAGNSNRKTVTLVRDEIKLSEAHAKAAIIDLPQTGGRPLRVGVIDLRLFYGRGDKEGDGASADTIRLIRKLKQEGVRGLILDLRRNGGGSLDEAIRLTGLFIPSGPVVQTLGPEDDVEVGISPETNSLYDGPVVVLTSRLSASASEIVAGALQDYGRALIVGDSSTFGKGTVQTVVPLREFFHQRGLGEVDVTIGKFYRPSGASTQLRGVVPDIVLPSETDLPDIGEANLPNALSWDILPPTTYAKFDLVRPVLGALREKSRTRVAADPGFRLVREELAMEEKDEDSNSVSLNEADRLCVKVQADEIGAEMKKVVLAEAARTPPAYYITLANVDSPRVPPTREPVRASAAVAKPGEINQGEDVELREAENILTDYINALPTPLGVIGAETAPKLVGSSVSQTSSK
jgi:carboxyl-terminal processing protease